jgi:hypothetical protein
MRQSSYQLTDRIACLPPSDRHDTGLICSQFGIVHDCDPESPGSALFWSRPLFMIYSGLALPCMDVCVQ